MKNLSMRWLMLCGMCGVMGGAGLTGCSVGAPVELREREMDIPETVATTVPWVSGEDDSWRSGAPLFAVEDKSIDLSAKAWLAAGLDSLQIRFVVSDREHVPPFRSTPWAGDGVELCIDARGDRTRGLGPEFEGTQGPDDAKFMMALTADGPLINCTASSDPAKRGAMPEGTLEVSRDEVRGETTYDLRLPWTFFETKPGLYPTLGLAVQFNDLDPGMKDKNVLKWGEGTFGPFRPGLFNALQVESPPGNYEALAIDRTILWNPTEPGRAYLALIADKPSKLQLRMGEQIFERTLPASDGMRRYEILLHPTDRDRATQDFEITLTSGGRELLNQKGTLDFPAGAYQATIRRLEELMARGGDDLFMLHLDSVRSLVMSEWARLGLFRDADPLEAEVSRQAIDTIRKGLNADAGEWDTYRDGKRNLIFAYVSRRDRSVQYYQFAFPNNWDRDQAYPLFFELHGAGSANPLSGVAAQLGALDGPSTFHGYGAPRTIAAIERAGFYCQPFGRGNLGYRGIGEIDVWEAYDDVHRRFKIDPDRRYLYGFSMGGGGTWSIGTRTPDRWAAMAILAGGLWREQAKHDLGGNIAHLPIFLWCGEKDSLFPNLALMQGLIEKHGGKPVVKTTPDLAHNYHADIQKETFDWMQQFTRKRPDAFSYVADTEEHSGAWGVNMVRDLTVSGLPRFDCTIQGQIVRIDSQGAPGLEVVAGKDGLGLSGEIQIIWNGENVYQGEAKTVSFGQQPARRRR